MDPFHSAHAQDRVVLLFDFSQLNEIFSAVMKLLVEFLFDFAGFLTLRALVLA